MAVENLIFGITRPEQTAVVGPRVGGYVTIERGRGEAVLPNGEEIHADEVGFLGGLRRPAGLRRDLIARLALLKLGIGSEPDTNGTFPLIDTSDGVVLTDYSSGGAGTTVILQQKNGRVDTTYIDPSDVPGGAISVRPQDAFGVATRRIVVKEVGGARVYSFGDNGVVANPQLSRE